MHMDPVDRPTSLQCLDSPYFEGLVAAPQPTPRPQTHVQQQQQQQQQQQSSTNSNPQQYSLPPANGATTTATTTTTGSKAAEQGQKQHHQQQQGGVGDPSVNNENQRPKPAQFLHQNRFTTRTTLSLPTRPLTRPFTIPSPRLSMYPLDIPSHSY